MRGRTGSVWKINKNIGTNEGVQCGDKKEDSRVQVNAASLFSLRPTLTCLIQYDKLLQETWHAGRVILPVMYSFSFSLSPPTTSFLQTLEVPQRGDAASPSEKRGCRLCRLVGTVGLLLQHTRRQHTLMYFS